MSDCAIIQVKPGIGDTLWHLPFVRAIAAAQSEKNVVFLAPPKTLAKELLIAEPSVAEVMYFEHHGNEIQRGIHLLQLISLLLKQRVRTIFILDRTVRPALAAWVAGIPKRIGLGLGAQKRFITNEGIGLTHFHGHPIDWLKELLNVEGIPLPSTEPDLQVPIAASKSANKRFGSLRRPLLAIGVGASHVSKDWPDRHWLSFLRLIAEGFQGSVVLVGGSGHTQRANDLIPASCINAVNACDLTVMQCAALLQICDLYVGPDSGPLNLAAAVNTQAIGLFGPTPILNYTRFIRPVRATDDLSVQTSMVEIKPERVAAAVSRALLKS